MLRPKIFDTLKQYSWKQFRADLTAGVIVGIVALPLAIAFAIASGVSPEKGLVTAVVAGFLISALGGSRVQIGGPTGAFVVIVYEIVQTHGIEGLMVATFLGGIILCALGFMRFGAAIKFIPYPVTVGFTSGIAVIIFSSQIKDFLGLSMGPVPADFLEKWRLYGQHLNTVSFPSAAIAAGTVVFILIFQKLTKKVPGSLVAIIVSSALVAWFHLPVETIASRFGEIPSQLPVPRLPVFHWETIKDLVRPAFTIAILAGVESLLSAIVSDGMIGGKHRSNMELIAQGIANIVSPLFGGIPATGAIARTATNVHSGGRTPIAGIIHALTLLLIMLVFGQWAGLIPLPALAGILVVVAYRMSEWHSFVMVLKAPRSDAFILVVTFLLTVLIDLTAAIEIGIVLAALLFINRLSLTQSVSEVKGFYVDEEDREDPDALNKKVIPEGVEVYEINGPFFFGIVSTFIETMTNVENNPRVRILRMRHVSSIDATAINALRQVIHQSRKSRVALVLSGVRPALMASLEKADVVRLIGQDNISPNIDKALERSKIILQRRKA